MCAVSCAAGAAEPGDAGAGESGILVSTWRRVTDGEAWHGPGHWRVLASPFTQHYRFSSEHRHVWALGVERQYDDHWLVGGAAFRNSFGQPSAYLYLGHRTEALFGQPSLFFQWSAGGMYGYVGEFQSKVPLNVNGFSPAALLTLGWKLDAQTSLAVHALGDAGLMFQLSYDLR